MVRSSTLTTHQFLSDRAESARRVAFRGLDVGGRVAGGIATVAAAIAEDMRGRVPGQHRKQREGLALLTATMLDVRGANLMDLAASLPRAAERPDMRYPWIIPMALIAARLGPLAAGDRGEPAGRRQQPVPGVAAG